MEESLRQMITSVYYCIFKIYLTLLRWAQQFEWDCDHLLPKAISPIELELGLVGNIKVFSSSSFFWMPTHWTILLIASLRLTNKKSKQNICFTFWKMIIYLIWKLRETRLSRQYIFVFFSSHTRSYRGIWKFSFFFFWLPMLYRGGQHFSECCKPC